ncbi:MAG TPA: 4-hydroxy-3-methylbut-2-enyl diphosphate reductase [Ktedonobacterales bacterium]
MKVVKVTPRGYCYGVVGAMEAARRAARDPATQRPIYIIGLIVHNTFAVEELTKLGITTLDGPDRVSILEQVTEGTVIFTAHGVSPDVRARAAARGLHVIDATCPDVTRTHDLVNHLVGQGYLVLYIGKRGHPEPEGVIGEAPDSVFLVETEADIPSIPQRFRTAAHLAVTTQTTLSQWDTASLIRRLGQEFPGIEVHNEICHATQVRQEAVASMARGAELTLVVGDSRSNNTNRLVQVAEELAGSHAIRLDSVADLDLSALQGVKTVAITSGASTPSQVTREVIQAVERAASEAQ